MLGGKTRQKMEIGPAFNSNHINDNNNETKKNNIMMITTEFAMER